MYKHEYLNPVCNDFAIFLPYKNIVYECVIIHIIINILVHCMKLFPCTIFHMYFQCTFNTIMLHVNIFAQLHQSEFYCGDI